MMRRFPRVRRRVKQLDLGHKSGFARDLDVVVDAEGAEEEQHDPSRKVCQRALQGKAYGKSGGGKYGNEACRFDPERFEGGKDGQQENAVVGEVAGKLRQRTIYTRLIEPAPNEVANRPGNVATHHQNENERDGAQQIVGRQAQGVGREVAICTRKEVVHQLGDRFCNLRLAQRRRIHIHNQSGFLRVIVC